MPGVSIHVVDVARGIVARGMRVELMQAATVDVPANLLASGDVGANGLFEHPLLHETFARGHYVALFHVAEFYRSAGMIASDVAFLDVVHYRFGIADPSQHYHLPMKLTPWGYSCFRGGA